MLLSRIQLGPTPNTTIAEATRPSTARRAKTVRVVLVRQRPEANGYTAPAAMMARPTQRSAGPSSPRTQVTRWSSGMELAPLIVTGTKNMTMPIAE